MGEKYFQETLSTLEVDSMLLPCPHCERDTSMNPEIVFRLMNNEFICESCGFHMESSNYIFDYEEI